MIINYKSFYNDLSNKTVYWLPMDTEERYTENLKNNYHKLKKYGWLDKPIEYTFNSHGFRCAEFKQEPNIVFIGCSLTIGIGIHAANRWTDIVANHLNLTCYNLGIGGSSSDTAFRMLSGWIDKLNPSIVVFKRPPGTRFELVFQDKIYNLTIHSDYNKFINYFIMYYAKDGINAELNYQKNLLAIKSICNDRNIKLFVDNDISMTGEYIDYARDLAHPGIIHNLNYARFILNNL